jgi:alanine racemase
LAYADKIEANVARLGLGLYGINSSSEKFYPVKSAEGGVALPQFNGVNLKPVLEMRSIISSVKTLAKGDYIGYNITYEASRDMRVATVPVGYFEGVDRRLSNIGSFLFGDQKCPIVGRVSMNITSVDVSSANDIKMGSKITVISSNSQDDNSVENIAKLAHTIPYEILVHIPPHLKRKIIKV